MSACFLSCDWGTSSFRLNLVGLTGETPVATVTSDDALGAVHRAGGDHEHLPLGVVRDLIKRLAAQAGRPLDGVPLVISGMADATMGLRKLPYRTLPFALNEAGLSFGLTRGSAEFPHDYLLISGARTAEDVMCGEETRLVGACRLAPAVAEDGLVILAGIHRKHVRVRGRQAVDLKTYLTGEYSDLMARRSIAASPLDESANAVSIEAEAAFADGVRAGAKDNLLHDSLAVRIGQITDAISPGTSYHYLSGLVMGAELKDLSAAAEPAITLIGSVELTLCYARALAALEWPHPVRIVPADRALIAGQRMVALHAGLLVAAG